EAGVRSEARMLRCARDTTAISDHLDPIGSFRDGHQRGAIGGESSDSPALLSLLRLAPRSDPSAARMTLKHRHSSGVCLMRRLSPRNVEARNTTGKPRGVAAAA